MGAGRLAFAGLGQALAAVEQAWRWPAGQVQGPLLRASLTPPSPRCPPPATSCHSSPEALDVTCLPLTQHSPVTAMVCH